MVISSNPSVERSNRVVAPGQYMSSKDGMVRSSGTWGENLGGGGGCLLAPGTGTEEVPPLLLWAQMVGLLT